MSFLGWTIMIRPINRCLNHQLRAICQKSVQLDEINAKVKEYLPESLADYCLVGSFNKGCLLITTTNASWATKLRYALPELRDNLRKNAGFYQLMSIKVTLLETQYQQPLVKPKSPSSLSTSSRNAIRAASELCTYIPLKEALNQLAEDRV